MTEPPDDVGAAVATPPAEALAPRPPPARRRALLRRLRGFAGLAARGALIFAALTMARASLADQYQVPTSSMAPTIEPGDRIFVDKMAYDLRLPWNERSIVDRAEPVVGELVIFMDPRDGETTLVKRVVALAGQTVAVRRGTLIVDGKAQVLARLDDGRLVERLGSVTHAAGQGDLSTFGPVTVPADHVFVMGDNRAVSLDSRVIGPIPRDLLRGRVVGVVYHDGSDGFDLARAFRLLD